MMHFIWRIEGNFGSFIFHAAKMYAILFKFWIDVNTCARQDVTLYKTKCCITWFPEQANSDHAKHLLALQGIVRNFGEMNSYLLIRLHTY